MADGVAEGLGRAVQDQPGGEPAGEGIARADGVDRGHGFGRHAVVRVAVRARDGVRMADEAAALAERDHHGGRGELAA